MVILRFKIGVLQPTEIYLGYVITKIVRKNTSPNCMKLDSTRKADGAIKSRMATVPSRYVFSSCKLISSSSTFCFCFNFSSSTLKFPLYLSEITGLKGILLIYFQPATAPQVVTARQKLCPDYTWNNIILLKPGYLIEQSATPCLPNLELPA